MATTYEVDVRVPTSGDAQAAEALRHELAARRPPGQWRVDDEGDGVGGPDVAGGRLLVAVLLLDADDVSLAEQAARSVVLDAADAARLGVRPEDLDVGVRSSA